MLGESRRQLVGLIEPSFTEPRRAERHWHEHGIEAVQPGERDTGRRRHRFGERASDGPPTPVLQRPDGGGGCPLVGEGRADEPEVRGP